MLTGPVGQAFAIPIATPRIMIVPQSGPITSSPFAAAAFLTSISFSTVTLSE